MNMAKDDTLELPEWIEGPEIEMIEIGGVDPGTFTVGVRGVTRIERTWKSSHYSNIAYVRVWILDSPLAEFCQHNLAGVYFAKPC